MLANGKLPKNFNDLSISPTGTLSQYSVQNDMIIGKYYNFVLVNCRLDVGPINRDGSEPAFLYEACDDVNSPTFKTGNIYCYYLTDNTRATERDEICQQLTSYPMEQYSTKGRCYKM